MKARTLLILLGLALVVIVAALIHPVMVDYRERSLADRVVQHYRRIEAQVRTLSDDQGEFADCDGLRAEVGDEALRFDEVTLDVGFEPVELGERLGYRPVFVVCGAVGSPHALPVARYAQQRFAALDRIEAGPIVRDSAVAFAVPLGAPDRIACLAPPTTLPRLCGRRQVLPDGPNAG
ncbi:MAG: hypothetical protein KDF95_17170 [Rhodocyclaceae bacterium]|nr:hypothetical protein [Rhodocyclaceae bacterium]